MWSVASYVLCNTIFEIQDDGHVLSNISKLKAFSSRFAFETVAIKQRQDGFSDTIWHFGMCHYLAGGGGGMRATILGDRVIIFPSCLGEGHNFFQGFLGEGHNFF